MDKCQQSCISYFVASYTATNKPRNQHILGVCTVLKSQTKNDNYQYILVFTNFTILFSYVYVGKS